ncbi:3'-5' exonuclease domain-containing protein 2 [Porifericola rhodea]|uniref:3'-5' exonuclease n=1 Tax=Porifericola rhodea TaxID=930972 RepID=UPI00266667ED|nr:3'-5' exonuclease [Porifericola rhodea]WKN32931.1 3'-5' exonuclease domain-containing protein 2 [Porifericola rhodea]
MFPKQITKEEINALTLKKYEGKVKVITQEEHLEEAIQHIREYDVFGFDTETKPAFRKGVKHMVALLQIAIPDMVYLIRLNHIGFTKKLSALFEEEGVAKVGISIRDDLKHLKELSSKHHIPFDATNIIELNDVAHSMGIEHAGVKKLTAIFLQFRVSKSQQTSNWENPQLTEKQIRYAATDAWVCLEIYDHLTEKGYI